MKEPEDSKYTDKPLTGMLAIGVCNILHMVIISSEPTPQHVTYCSVLCVHGNYGSVLCVPCVFMIHCLFIDE